MPRKWEKVKMVKTLAPDEIPNGSIDKMHRSRMGRASGGLHYAEFGGFACYVYRHEVKIIKQRLSAKKEN